MATRDRERGFTVLEVVVAITILVVALAGVGALLGNAIVVSGNTRNRVIAQQIATQYIEDVRGTAADPAKFASITIGTTVSAKTVSGITFTVTQVIDVVNVGSQQSTCDAPGTNTGHMLRVRERVTWPRMAGTATVRETTVLSPPIGDFNASSGSIAVKVFDSVGALSQLVTVQVAGPTTQSMQTTPEGCAFFTNLTPGTYTASITAGTGVGDQEVLVPSQTASVAAAQTASLQFNYDSAATIAVTGYTNSAATPATGMPLSVVNTGLQPYAQYSFPSGVTSLSPLFPYSSGYTLFAGNCTDNNPLGKDTSRALFYTQTPPAPTSVTKNQTTVATIPLYTLALAAKVGVTPVAGATVTATPTAYVSPSPYVSVCTSGTTSATGATLGLVTSDAGGNSVTAMPLGHYTVTVKCTPPNAACPVTAKTGTVKVWVKPDAVYQVDANGYATAAFASPIPVTLS